MQKFLFCGTQFRTFTATDECVNSFSLAGTVFGRHSLVRWSVCWSARHTNLSDFLHVQVKWFITYVVYIHCDLCYQCELLRNERRQKLQRERHRTRLRRRKTNRSDTFTVRTCKSRDLIDFCRAQLHALYGLPF